MDQHGHARAGAFQGGAAEVPGTLPDDVLGVVFYRAGEAGVFEDHQAGAHGYVKLFVGVEGDRVGFLDAAQQVFVGAGEQGWPAPGGVDVEVGAEFPGDIGHGIQRVDVAGFGGAGHAADGHDLDLLLLQLQTFVAQGVGLDAVEFVGFHRHQGIPAKAEDIGGFAQGIVAAFGDDDGGAFMAVVFQGAEQAFFVQTAEAAFSGEGSVASHPQGGEVGDRAAGTHGAQGVPGIVHPFTIERTVFLVHQPVYLAQYLAFHGRERLGGFGFHQVLVQGDHDLRQRQHEVGQCRGHVADERG